jgi:prepilin signal peptidase PulO-like enzyme (type II secretory pathway)
MKNLILAGIWFVLGYIIYTDIRYMKIYNKSIIFLLSLILIYLLFFSNDDVFQGILGCFIGGLPLSLTYIISNSKVGLAINRRAGSLGGGDVKLAGAIGLLLGYHKTLLAIFFGCIFQLMFLILKKNKRSRPFAPAISIGCFLSFYWGNEFILFLLNLIF